MKGRGDRNDIIIIVLLCPGIICLPWCQAVVEILVLMVRGFHCNFNYCI